MIVTHTNPDFDAICGVWLLKRFGGLESEPVEFVNTGNPDQEKLNSATAVVDTGRKLESIERRFDHHHLPGQDANNTCAAMQVFVSLRPWSDIDYLKPLIDLIFAGDTGRAEANESRELGIHALLSGFKALFREEGKVASDDAIMEYGFHLLDALGLCLQNQAKARAELNEKTMYKSSDGLIWVIRHGSQGSSFAAFEEGARIVIFEGQPVEVDGGTTFPVGIMRAGEWQEPHVGELAERVRELADYDIVTGGQPGDYSQESEIMAEIDRWFKHPAGFFAGRGTPKAPVFEPVEIDIVEFAISIDKAWKR